MPLAIAQLGQPVLRRVADPVPADRIGTEPVRRLIEEMRQTLRAAGGVGLAAPQVFVSLRLFLAILDPPAEGQEPMAEVLINPRIASASEEKDSAWEGCLSFPELSVLVPRHRSVRVEYLDAEGQARTRELEGFPARVVQHENDHLDGILTIDRAASTRDIIQASELAALRRQTPPLE